MALEVQDGGVCPEDEKNYELEKLKAEHRDYDNKLESLISKQYLSPEEEFEVVDLKKKKLALKDKMALIIKKLELSEEK